MAIKCGWTKPLSAIKYELRCSIPEKYIIEMVCDMIGASKAYLKREYDQKEPYNYFIKNKNNMMMDEEAKTKLESYLEEIAK